MHNKGCVYIMSPALCFGAEKGCKNILYICLVILNLKFSIIVIKLLLHSLVILNYLFSVSIIL